MSATASEVSISPIELEIIYNALTAAAAEMDVTVWRTSRSTIVRELLDYSTAIFDRNGWNVAQAARIPSHLNSMSFFLTEILAKHIPHDHWGPDDVLISNDPYCGGQHLPDIVAFKAVFHQGRRVGFVGTLCHHLDVGGSSPGSYGSSAIEIFQEGLRIPPVKLIDNGRLVEPLRAIILQNVRQPDILWGDLQSQIASLHVGARNIEGLVAKLGTLRFEHALSKLLDASEAGIRAVIGRIPDGTYSFEDSIDDDGITDKPIRIHAAITVNGDHIAIDLSGCSPQSLGPSNATLASTYSTVFYALLAIADSPVSPNAGCYRPVEIIALPGSCVNASAPAPVVHRIAIGHRLATVILGALYKAIPDRIPAAYYAVSFVVTFQNDRSACGPQGAGRDRDRRLWRAELLGRCVGALVWHAQQLEYPDRDDRKRHAADVHGLRSAAGLGRRGPSSRRARPVAGMEGGLPDRATIDQSRPVQVPPVRARRRRGGSAEFAVTRPRWRAPPVAVEGHQPHGAARRYRPAGNLWRRRLRTGVGTRSCRCRP